MADKAITAVRKKGRSGTADGVSEQNLKISQLPDLVQTYWAKT